MIAIASHHRTTLRLLTALALACILARTLVAQDSAATVAVRTVESLRHDEWVRLRPLGAPAKSAPVLGRFRRHAGDTLWIVPEPPRPKPLFHRGRPIPYAMPALATVEAGRRIRGGRESINRGAQQGFVNGILLFAALGALIGATDDGGCGGNDCLFSPITPWQGVQAGAMMGITIGPIVGAMVGGARTSWRWQPVAVPR